MRLAALLMCGLAVPVAAEPLPGCNDGQIHRMIVGWHGPARAWVEFYSQEETSDDNNFMFDRWTLLHCPTNLGVGVRGFEPFPYPSDILSDPDPEISPTDRKIFAAMGAAVSGHDLLAGREGADALVDRLRGAGVEARTGPGDKGSCVCGPMWK